MPPSVQLALLAALAIVVIAVGARLLYSLVVAWSPERRERQRRLKVNRLGRLGDALITDATDTTLYYAYSVRGVQYETSQDIAALRDRLPAEPERLIGMAHMKYAPKNPANSILVCEDWSGLRTPAAAATRAAGIK